MLLSQPLSCLVFVPSSFILGAITVLGVFIERGSAVLWSETQLRLIAWFNSRLSCSQAL